MTKKSASRLARDEAKQRANNAVKDSNEVDTSWDDLEALYGENKTQLLAVANIAVVMKENPGLYPYIPEPAKFADNIRSITNDVKEIDSLIEATHAKHAGKTGGAADGDEIMLSINVVNEYHTVASVYEGTVMPVINEVIASIEIAERRFLEANPKPVETVPVAEAPVVGERGTFGGVFTAIDEAGYVPTETTTTAVAQETEAAVPVTTETEG